MWTVAYSYFFKAELLCSLFLVLLVGPNLISRDLRFNAMPLLSAGTLMLALSSLSRRSRVCSRI